MTPFSLPSSGASNKPSAIHRRAGEREPPRRSRRGSPAAGDNPTHRCARRRRRPWPCPPPDRPWSPRRQPPDRRRGPRRSTTPAPEPHRPRRPAGGHDPTKRRAGTSPTSTGPSLGTPARGSSPRRAADRRDRYASRPPTSTSPNSTPCGPDAPHRDAHPGAPDDPPPPRHPTGPAACPPPPDPHPRPTTRRRRPPRTGQHCAILHSQEVPPDLGQQPLLDTAILPAQRGISANPQPPTPQPVGGSRLSDASKKRGDAQCGRRTNAGCRPRSRRTARWARRTGRDRCCPSRWRCRRSGDRRRAQCQRRRRCSRCGGRGGGLGGDHRDGSALQPLAHGGARGEGANPHTDACAAGSLTAQDTTRRTAVATCANRKAGMMLTFLPAFPVSREWRGLSFSP